MIKMIQFSIIKHSHKLFPWKIHVSGTFSYIFFRDKKLFNKSVSYFFMYKTDYNKTDFHSFFPPWCPKKVEGIRGELGWRALNTSALGVLRKDLWQGISADKDLCVVLFIYLFLDDVET